MGIEAVDTSGQVVWRVDQSVMSTAVIKLEIGVVGRSSFSLLPGESVNISVSVTNVAANATWYIRVNDTLHFYTGLWPIA